MTLGATFEAAITNSGGPVEISSLLLASPSSACCMLSAVSEALEKAPPSYILDSACRRSKSISTRKAPIARCVPLKCEKRTTPWFTELTAPRADFTRKLLKIWSAPHPIVIASLSAFTQTWQAAVPGPKINAEARCYGPKFATWRHKRTCCA